MELGTYSKHWQNLGLDLKRGYQVNICWSMLIVYGTIIIALAALTILPRKAADKAVIHIDIMSVPDTTGDYVHGVMPEENPAGTSDTAFKSILLPENYPRGYMPKIEIIRESSPLPIMVSASSRTDAHEPSLEKVFSEIDPQSNLEESNVASYGSGDVDDGLPLVKPYFPPMQHSFSTPNLNISKRQEKGLIMLAAIFWPTVASKNDTGYVEIVLDIDQKGRIQWLVIDEQPKGKGFASALAESLKRSKFKPPTDENGEKIRVRLTLTSTLCYNCLPYVVSNTSNMEAVQLMPNQ